MIEAMAQTAGILVGEARQFQEKVILAKIKNAVFYHYVQPGDTIILSAEIESIAPEAASTSANQTRRYADCTNQPDVQSYRQEPGRKQFPEENFVLRICLILC